jgi:hypothetical protein
MQVTSTELQSHTLVYRVVYSTVNRRKLETKWIPPFVSVEVLRKNLVQQLYIYLYLISYEKQCSDCLYGWRQVSRFVCPSSISVEYKRIFLITCRGWLSYHWQLNAVSCLCTCSCSTVSSPLFTCSDNAFHGRFLKTCIVKIVQCSFQNVINNIFVCCLNFSTLYFYSSNYLYRPFPIFSTNC